MDLSIIFVCYNSKDVLDVALEAVFKSETNYSYEVIIVDNASPDGGVEMVKEKYLSRLEIAAKTKLILNDSNQGFGIGNNLGMKQAIGDYILLLNTDTKVDPDNFQVMIDFMKSRSDVGGATCKLVKADGNLDLAARRSEPDLIKSFFKLFGLQQLFPKWFGGYNMLDKDPSHESELEACSGAYLMMSRAAYEKVGGFDERFFMYGEDLDLCRRIREAGFKIWWYPKTSCIHYRGQSTKRTPQKMLFAFYDAMWIYYKKWYSKRYFYLMDPFVFVGTRLLYYFKTIKNILQNKTAN